MATIEEAYRVAVEKMGGAVAVRKFRGKCQIGVYVGKEFEVRAEGETWEQAIGKLLEPQGPT